uniref:Uncharacterized protein n=1 Tax=Anguilla anguilla TaxID=7936 RepID=A0A0E9T354_ANGAN
MFRDLLTALKSRLETLNSSSSWQPFSFS